MILHRLEQCRLRLRGRSIDLVREQELTKNRPRHEGERGRLPIENARASNVARHQVRRELNALEPGPRHTSERARDERLSETGRAFEKRVSASDRSEEQTKDDLLLPNDDLRHLRPDA